MKKHKNLDRIMDTRVHFKKGMSKIAIVMVIIFFVLPVQAQFTFGVRTGLSSLSIMSGQISDPKLAFQIGALVNDAINDRLSVEPEILFITYSALNSLDVQIDPQTGEVIKSAFIKIPNKFIQIPIRVRYKIGNKLVVQGGPYFGFEFGGKCEVETTINGTKQTTIYTPKDFFEQHNRHPGDEYKVFDWGLGAGISRQFGKNIHVGIEITRRVNSPKKAILIPARVGSFSLAATYYIFGNN